jgi:hypothetical protein
MRWQSPWLRLGIEAWRLGLEASSVVALRSVKLATASGSVAQAEARRMVDEKIEAALALQAQALSGRLGITPRGAAAKTLAHYRRRVRANKRRLAKA